MQNSHSVREFEMRKLISSACSGPKPVPSWSVGSVSLRLCMLGHVLIQSVTVTVPAWYVKLISEMIAQAMKQPEKAVLLERWPPMTAAVESTVGITIAHATAALNSASKYGMSAAARAVQSGRRISGSSAM